MTAQQKSPTPLTHPQKKHLRARGHALSPAVSIGKEGLSAAVLKAIDTALADHELIKVKIIGTSEVNKHEAAAILPQQTASELVQLIGKTFLLFRRNDKKKKEERITLP